MSKNPITYEQVKELYDQGLSVRETARRLGCSACLVQNRLDRQGEVKTKYILSEEKEEKTPVHPEEVERYRENLKIGQQVTIFVRDADLEKKDGKKTKYKTVKCIVTEKYKWHFIAEDRKGRRYSTTYIEMLKWYRELKNMNGN